jgi:hypothetical protein
VRSDLSFGEVIEYMEVVNMIFEIGDTVQSVFGGEELTVTKVEPRRITAVSRDGAVFQGHPHNFTLIRREKTSEDE